ncbi:hypothetical protein [Streptomyces sp. NBC_00344]|uniref:hypothetical protein n=1 Tax=Streptomyces sp. NBC_00344 TaxID=2975720 RepID=UPI002E233A66
MLALRLVRSAEPLVLLRRLMVAAASAAVGFLLLSALGYAMGHPGHPTGARLHLLWCAVPLAAAVHFAVSVARTDPSARPRSGMTAAGLGPAGLAGLAALSTALSCTLGSVVALLLFLQLRGDIAGLPLDGAAAGLLGAGARLPLAGTLTLLAVTPAVATAVSAWVLRPRRAREPAGPQRADGAPAAAPNGLPWGVALVAAGIAVETYYGRHPGSTPLPVPGRFDGSPAGVLAGWTLTALGLALAGPGLTHLCGRLLQAVRPGGVRLLAGRVLQAEARRIGRPLGVVCAVLSGIVAAASLNGTGQRLYGPLTELGAAVVVACTVATLLTAVRQAKQERTDETRSLLRVCAPAGVLRTAAAVRAAAVFALFAAVTGAVSALAAAPLSG